MQRLDQILFESAPSGTPYMNYLAIFCPSQFQAPQGGPCGRSKNGSNNGRAIRVEKNISGCQDAVSMMMLSKKLRFSTLGSQILNYFVWKLKAGNLLIYLNFCLATLFYNLRCKD